MDGIEKEGYLELFARGVGGEQPRVWQRRYYVLYRATAKNAPRLDWYETKEIYQKQPNLRKSMYLEQIVNASLERNEDRKNSFSVEKNNGERLQLFSASNEIECKAWVKAFIKAKRAEVSNPKKDDPISIDRSTINYIGQSKQQYNVEMNPTEAATRMNLQGAYTLCVAETCIALCKPRQLTPALTWNLKHIRRYGRNANSFTFEAGRRCDSGEGVFTVMTNEGENIFELVQNRTHQMRLNTPPSLPSSPPPMFPGDKRFVNDLITDDYSEPLPLPENTYSDPDNISEFKMSDVVAQMRLSGSDSQQSLAQYDQVDFSLGSGLPVAGKSTTKNANTYGTVAQSDIPPPAPNDSDYDSIHY